MKRGEVTQGYKDCKEIINDAALDGRDLLVGAALVCHSVREGSELIAKGVFAGLYFGLGAIANAIVEKIDENVTTEPLVITDLDNTLLGGEYAGEDFDFCELG